MLAIGASPPPLHCPDMEGASYKISFILEGKKTNPSIKKEDAISEQKGCSHLFVYDFSLGKLGRVHCFGKTETFTA